jgi:hypothetical protein
MIEPPPAGNIGPKGNSDSDAKPAGPPAASPPPPKLTAEEQMALFEKELKENDWGHQPC